MATHSSILAWKISWTEEPGGLQSMGSQRVGHDWVTNIYNTCWPQLTTLLLLSCYNHVQLFATLWTVVRQCPLCMGFSRQEYWMGCRALLQGIFPTQGLNPGLLLWQQVLYHQGHLGNSSQLWIHLINAFI